MWRQIVACLVVSGCGFQSRAAADGAAPQQPDAASPGDAASDAVPSCLAHWHAGDLSIATPVELMSLSTDGDERDPWISTDGLRLYFARQPRNGDADLFMAHRNTVADPFGSAAELRGVNSQMNNDGRPALTPDETTLVFASDRPPGNQFNDYLATRKSIADDFGPVDASQLMSVNTTAGNHYDPFLASGGKRIYLAPSAPNQHIVAATRGSDGKFGTPVDVAGISAGDTTTDADPAVTDDELILVFTSERSGGPGKADLWYSARPNTLQDFPAPKLIPVVNGPDDEGDPMLSADGCTLYFSSTRDSGDFDLFAAQIAR